MKLISASVAVAALLTTVPATPQAQEADSDPLRVIYRVSGVVDDGGAQNTGIATTFFCTNFSNVAERVRISLRPESGGGPTTNKIFDFTAGRTKTFSTHFTAAYSEDDALTPGVPFRQASALISATSTNVHCSAVQVDASTVAPTGIALHMVRIRPANNSQEAASDPLRVIYRVSGVLDDGNADDAGSATTFFCTNFSNVAERVRISLRLETPGAPINGTFDLAPGETKTLSTHFTTAYDEDGTLAPGVVFRQGSALISATSTNVHCSAAQVDASAATPIGIPLHMARIRPANSSQE